MVVMAIDHVRDFFHFPAVQGIDPLDLARTTPAIFLTRWITHFCAPLFSFLAGTGVYLAFGRGRSKRELSWFLVTRGLWLIFLELTVFMWFGWQFEITLQSYIIATLWALGWSMILLAGLIHLPKAAVAWIGVAMIVLHNATDGINPASWGHWAWLWQVLHAGGNFKLGPIAVWAFYPLIPWLGVMPLGYVFGSLYSLDAGARRKRLLQLGLGLLVGFLLLRLSNLYGDHQLWAPQSRPGFTLLSFINVTKYPPSLLYLMLTLGTGCLLLAWFERGTPALLRPFLVFGRVPMFYYLIHIPLAHALAWIWFKAHYGYADFLLGGPGKIPPDAGVSLLAVYGIWFGIVLALYPACRWYADYKRRHRDNAWLTYL